jgi:hypothetical protein
MEIENVAPDLLWRYYQRGYHCLVRSGLYFRQVLRPALSHVYFQRAVPLLMEYARANRGAGDLPPGFGEQLEACPLTPRDLLHLDYAICLGYAEAQGERPTGLSGLSVLDWPGPGGSNGVFLAVDAEVAGQDVPDWGDDTDDLSDDSEDDDSKPPFDL